MSPFRPVGTAGGDHVGYSPHCVPVIFVRDNDLLHHDVVPEEDKGAAPAP